MLESVYKVMNTYNSIQSPHLNLYTNSYRVNRHIHSLAVIGAVRWSSASLEINRRPKREDAVAGEITLHVDVENAVGIQLYKSFGFVQKQRRKKHYGAMGNDGIKMDLFI